MKCDVAGCGRYNLLGSVLIQKRSDGVITYDASDGVWMEDIVNKLQYCPRCASKELPAPPGSLIISSALNCE